MRGARVSIYFHEHRKQAKVKGLSTEMRGDGTLELKREHPSIAEETTMHRTSFIARPFRAGT